MPPEKFEKLNPLRLNLWASLMVYCMDYSKAVTLQNNYIWLSSRLHYLSKELHYLIEELCYHNKINLKGTLLDMNHITTLRNQSMNIIIC